MALHLGLIPDWQFSNNPAVNSRINAHVTYPAGWNQMTVQPVGTYITSGDPAPLSGFFDSWVWQNRKVIAVSVLGVIAAAVAGVSLKVLK